MASIISIATVSATATVPPPPPEPPKRSRVKSWRFYVAFSALSLVAFTGTLDATILSIALPVVARDLNGSSLEAFWAGIAFLLASVVFLPICTSCSDIFGRKSVLYVCIAFFCLGSVLVATTRTMRILILGRTVQGIGGGGLEALCGIILTDMTTLRERPLWLGIMGFMWSAGSVTGPLLGGAFSQKVTWRWIGWINLPLMGLALVLLVPFLRLTSIDLSIGAKVRSLDWVGIPLFMVGMTSASFGLTAGGILFPWSSYGALVPLILGVAVLVVFVVYERFPEEPMIPYRIFADRTGVIALGTSVLHGIILYAIIYYLPIYFEGVIGDKPLRSAVESLGIIITVTSFGIICSFAIEYMRTYCFVVWAGWILTTIGMGIMSLLDVDTKLISRVSFQLIAGIGLGTLYPALTMPTQAAVGTDDHGLVSGILVFARQLGAVVGLASGSAIFTNLFNERVPADLPGIAREFANGNAAVNAIPYLRSLGLSPAELRPLLACYSHALKGVWWTLTGVAGVAFLITLLMKDIDLENDEKGRQAFHDFDTPGPEMQSLHRYHDSIGRESLRAFGPTANTPPMLRPTLRHISLSQDTEVAQWTGIPKRKGRSRTLSSEALGSPMFDTITE